MRLLDKDLDRQLQEMTEELKSLPAWLRDDDTTDTTGRATEKSGTTPAVTCD